VPGRPPGRQAAAAAAPPGPRQRRAWRSSFGAVPRAPPPRPGRSSSPSRSRPRDSRDLTVPTVTPVCAATASTGRSRQWCSTSASRTGTPSCGPTPRAARSGRAAPTGWPRGRTPPARHPRRWPGPRSAPGAGRPRGGRRPGRTPRTRRPALPLPSPPSSTNTLGTGGPVPAMFSMFADSGPRVKRRRPPGQRAGARSSGQLMQRGPPRPRPSSNPGMVTTSTPSSRSRWLVSTLRS
jgi:hypothetical protein